MLTHVICIIEFPSSADTAEKKSDEEVEAHLLTKLSEFCLLCGSPWNASFMLIYEFAKDLSPISLGHSNRLGKLIPVSSSSVVGAAVYVYLIIL